MKTVEAQQTKANDHRRSFTTSQRFDTSTASKCALDLYEN